MQPLRGKINGLFKNALSREIRIIPLGEQQKLWYTEKITGKGADYGYDGYIFGGKS